MSQLGSGEDAVQATLRQMDLKEFPGGGGNTLCTRAHTRVCPGLCATAKEESGKEEDTDPRPQKFVLKESCLENFPGLAGQGVGLD